MPSIIDCNMCKERCPQADRAREAGKGRMYATKELTALLKKVESGQLVEVVRCEKCKWWQRHTDVNKDYGPCRRYGSTMRFDDYCSYGRVVVWGDGAE